MARRNTREHLAVSLFPFLSILACVIGVLTLMITALALGQITEKAANQDEIDRAQEFVKLKEESAQLTPRLASIRDTLEKSRALEIELQKAQAAREALEKQMKETKAPPLTAAQLKAQADAAQKKNEQMKQQLDELLTLLTPMREEAAKIPDAAEQGKITVRPGGSGSNLKPVFVECAEKGIVIHESPALIVLRTGMETNAAYLTVLDRVAKQEDATIIFLVRPSGIATYNQARAIARARYARNGKLPVPGEGPLDLSLFRK